MYGYSSRSETTDIQVPVWRLAKAVTQVKGLQFLGLRKPKLDCPRVRVSTHSSGRYGSKSAEAEEGLNTGILTASTSILPVRLWDKCQEGTSCWKKWGQRCPESKVQARVIEESWFSTAGWEWVASTIPVLWVLHVSTSRTCLGCYQHKPTVLIKAEGLSQHTTTSGSLCIPCVLLANT